MILRSVPSPSWTLPGNQYDVNLLLCGLDLQLLLGTVFLYLATCKLPLHVTQDPGEEDTQAEPVA